MRNRRVTAELHTLEFRTFDKIDTLNTITNFGMILVRYLSSEFKADQNFDYQGLEKEVYKAVSSYGIDIGSGTGISIHQY